MSLENTGPWKLSKTEQMKDNLDGFLNTSKESKKVVEKVFAHKKEEVVQNTSEALSNINSEILASNEVVAPLESDIANVKVFLETLSEDTKKNIGLLRYNTWSGEDVA